MRIFSNLNLDGPSPLRAQPGRGECGAQGIPSTRWKKFQRVIIPIIVVAIAVGLCFLGRVFYLILTGQ